MKREDWDPTYVKENNLIDFSPNGEHKDFQVQVEGKLQQCEEVLIADSEHDNKASDADSEQVCEPSPKAIIGHHFQTSFAGLHSDFHGVPGQ